jgi:AraC-like DNA-binding protein
LSDTLARIAGTCCDRAGAELLANATEPPRDDELGEYVHYLTSMEGDKRSSMRYPVERERELLDLVTAGDRAGAERSLQHLLHAVSSYEVKSADEARSRVLELVVLLSRAAIAGGADAEHVFGLEYRSLSRLRSLTSIEEIAAWLARVLSRFLDLVFDLREVRYSTHLSRVLQYVRDNFRRGITLADAAADAGLSSGYLGRIFREELQTSFTRYVQRVRIQEARRLLARTRLPVGDVGAQCGFPDHSYFTQLFRRETGESPTEYRDRSPTRWRRPL